MTELNGKTVYLLGAGFSIWATNGIMPALSGLSDWVIKRIDDSDSKSRMLSASSNNIEIWLSYLLSKKNWLGKTERDQDQELYENIVNIISKRFIQLQINARSTKMSNLIPLKHLVEDWHEQKSVIISFNYDTLIEEFCQMYCGGIHSGDLYPLDLIDIESQYKKVGLETLKLIKLHGSINWYCSANWYFSGTGALSDKIYFFNYGPERDPTIKLQTYSKKLENKIPFLIPPQMDKQSIYNHQTIKNAFKKAYTALKTCERLVCIGFSFPPTDQLIFYLIKNALLERTVPLEVMIVNTDTKKKFKEKMGSIFLTGQKIVKNIKFSKSIDEFLIFENS